MQPEREIAFDWIRSGRRKSAESRTPEWAGNFVSHLIPPVYEAYAKVLHRIDAHYEIIDSPLSQSEIAILKIPSCEPLRSFVENRRTNSQSGRIRWRELSELLKVPFAPEICHEWYRGKLEQGCWPRLLNGPGEGGLGEEECAELASKLTPFANIEPCFFHFAEMPFIGTDKSILFKGALDEVCGFLKATAYQFSPEYWWPSDHNWCVCSDYDLEFTIVGGSRKLISSLFTSDILECLEVTSQTRVDSFAPMP